MKGRWLWIVIGANLLMLVVLAFVYPHLMLAPGPLAKAHTELASDCFACHAPLRGAVAERCIVCHAVPDIGLRTTKGTAIATAESLKRSFHQELNDQDCMACHSDHAGPKLSQRSRKRFSHALLRQATRDECDSCHRAPTDELHRQIAGNCAQCHRSDAWRPATFDHKKYFVLDKNHNKTCVTCHADSNYSRYTCYGCHEHTPANMRAEHRGEGVSGDLDNCVRCHRSAHGEGKRERGEHGNDRD